MSEELLDTTRTFKQPKSLAQCEKTQCRECAAMYNTITFSNAGCECYDMRKNLEFRKNIALRIKKMSKEDRILKINQYIGAIEKTIERHQVEIKKLYAEKDKYVEELELLENE